jgi:hypothetical protein
MKSLNVKAALATAMLSAAALVAAPAAHGGDHAGGSGSIVVQSIHPGSPAAAAGLEAGDRLLQLDGQEIGSHDDLKRILAARQPGDTVPLTVGRNAGTVELDLTFGERPDGGASIGVSLAVMGTDAGTAAAVGLTREECLAWVGETYRIDAMLRELGLGLEEDAQTLSACLESDLQRMRSPMPTGWCDNAFKIHCSGLDLLTEIGETLVERCAELLGEPLGSCASQKVFDRYARDGEASDEAACRAARNACSEPE